MADAKSVAEQIQEISERWNPPPTDDGLHRLVGDAVPEGDTRATAAYNPPSDYRSPASDKVDAQARQGYSDDLDDEDDGTVDPRVPYSERTNAELKDEIDRRNEGRDKDARLAKSGNHDDLVARLEEDDAESDEDGD